MNRGQLDSLSRYGTTIPSVNPSFTVLMVAPNPRRRDHLRQAIHRKPGWELWRFVAASEMTAESFLHEPILYRCDSDEGVPLAKPIVVESSPTPAFPVERAS